MQIVMSTIDHWVDPRPFRVDLRKLHTGLKGNQLIVGPMNDLDGAFHVLYPLIGPYRKTQDQRHGHDR